MAVKYLYPNGAKAPTQAQMEKKYASVHAVVEFAADAPLPPPNTAPPPPPLTLDVVHNLQFKTELPPEDLQSPLILVNPLAGSAGTSYAVALTDGDTVTFTKVGTGPISLDVWIFRHPVHGGLFGL